MSATTVKIEGELLALVESVKDPNQPVSAFVRQAVRRAAHDARRTAAAAVYNRLLDVDATESAWLEEWENADLAADPAEPVSGQSVTHAQEKQPRTKD